MLAVNTLLQNRYLIKRPLASGGMGAVYEAEDQRLGNVVALKETFFTDDYMRNVFEREARLLASLRHPALPVVSDYFSESDGVFLVMQFIPGDDLEKVMEKKTRDEPPNGQAKPFAVADVLRWADVLLDALDYLHTQDPSVIHRDIKPANIKVTPRGQVILLDFGLAKGGRSGMTHVFPKSSVLGFTENYAPIEQILSARLDLRFAAEALMTPEQVNRILEKGSNPASDLYSLAATFYHLLTCKVPESSIQRLLTTLRGQADPLRPVSELNPAVPNAVATVLHQAMALYREQRPASAAEMQAAIYTASLSEKPLPALSLRDDEKSTVIVLRDNHDKPTTIRPYHHLKTFEFETMTVDAMGKPIERRRRQARYYIEDLGGGVKLDMVEIPSGAFLMGSPQYESGQYSREVPQHHVTMSAFYLGMYEVTQAQWRAVASLPKVNRDLVDDPSRFKGHHLPVEQVSWDDAVEFCARLSNATGKTYRLPTEAEWEYACRAETTTPFHFGKTITPELANYNGNFPYGRASKGIHRGKTTPVGSLGAANGFGLLDMHGNVWEWCSDWYSDNYYSHSKIEDPTGPIRGSVKVLRGGGWSQPAMGLRSASRYWNAPDERLDVFGLRIGRTDR